MHTHFAQGGSKTRIKETLPPEQGLRFFPKFYYCFVWNYLRDTSIRTRIKTRYAMLKSSYKFNLRETSIRTRIKT